VMTTIILTKKIRSVFKNNAMLQEISSSRMETASHAQNIHTLMLQTMSVFMILAKKRLKFSNQTESASPVMKDLL
jgi:hypothetical protein